MSQPDRLAGRGQRLASPPVAEYARAHQLPLWQTARLRGPEAETRLRAPGADILVLAAFAALVPPNLLALTQPGILNVHPSLLPRWRGASPIQAALLAGVQETGVTIIRLVEQLDAGPVLAQQPLAVGPDEDYPSLEKRLAALGATLLLEALATIERGAAIWRAQDEAHASYCGRIDREDGRIDWTESAEHIWRQVRAYRGWPQAFTEWDGRLLKVLRCTPVATRSGAAAPGTVLASDELDVMTGSGVLRLDEVVLAGKRPQRGVELRRGYPRLVGTRL